ncbi:unnamed protein product [Penicillium pancosmium]
MPPPLPSHHRGMTANPLKPVGRYRPGKAVAEEESSSEEEEEDDVEAQQEAEIRRQAEARLRRQQAPKASSFPAAAVPKLEEQEDDEEGFVTEDEEDDGPAPGKAPQKAAPAVQPDTPKVSAPKIIPVAKAQESEEESEEEEESSEEESSSEDEAPRRMLIRPTFIKKDKRGNAAGQDAGAQSQPAPGATDSAAEDEKRRAQRQEKADQLVRDQLEKEAIARSAGNRAWDDDELVEADEEEAIDDRDGLDPEAEYAAWKLRELKRVKRAFFRDDLEREGIDQQNVMGRRFADDVNRETLPQYMQIRDMTKLGKKGRTRYRDLKSEDTGNFGEGYQNRRRDNAPPIGITDERFMPDQGDSRGPQGPTGANASAVRSRRMSRSRSRSPRRDRSRERRKRSPSPYEDRDKRRRVESSS